MNRCKKIPGDLTPIDTLTRDQCSPEWDKLDKALSSDNITNIAVSSSYGMGKTSFLKSYFKHNFGQKKPAKYRFISVPTFTSESDQSEIHLEKSIINQLLFTVNPNKYPYSRIDRIKWHSGAYPISIFVVLLAAITSFVYLSGYFSHLKELWVLIVGVIATIFLSYLVFRFLYYLLNKLSFGIESELGPVKLSGKIEDKNTETDLFIQYGDELKYYFSKSKIKYLILEDLDRFNDQEIFQNLRSLNLILNESLNGQRIVFIYTLNDSVFTSDVKRSPEYLNDENLAAKEKAKFFDYIIPIVPFNNLNNSRRLFEDELKKYDSLPADCIDGVLLSGISNYITDKREIISIVSEMDTYAQKLKKYSDMEIDYNKLFAAIIYKVVYPSDFDDISKGKSKLDYVLHNGELLQDIVENIEDEDPNIVYTPKFVEYYNKKSISTLLSIVFDSDTNDSSISSELAGAIDFLKGTRILRFLLLRGYIDKDLYEYISPSEFTELLKDEKEFVRNALIKADTGLYFKTNHVLKMIQVLDEAGVDYEDVFSSSILVEKINEGDYKNADKILTGAKVKGDFSIIYRTVLEINQRDKSWKKDNCIHLNRWLIDNWEECFNLSDKVKKGINNIGNYREAIASYVCSCLLIAPYRNTRQLVNLLVQNKETDYYVNFVNKMRSGKDKNRLLRIFNR